MGWGWPRLGDGLATGGEYYYRFDFIHDSKSWFVLVFGFDYLALLLGSS